MQKIDFYGNRINLTLNNSETIKTKFGGFMTIISIFLIFSIMWFLGNDIFYKKSPQTIIENNLYDIYQEIQIDFTEIPIGIALTDDNNNLINITNHFDIEIEYFRYHVSKEQNQIAIMNKDLEKKIKAYPCKIDMFDNKINKTQFIQSQLNFFYCPDFQNITLKGYWSEDELRLIAISIKKCNKNIHKDCKTDEEINDLIKSQKINFNLNFLQPRIKFNDYDDSISYSVINYYRYLATNSIKNSYFSIQENSLITDVGLFFSKSFYEDFYEPVQFGYDELDYNPNTKELMVVEIYSSNKNKYYLRSYIKLGNVLASLGGIIKLFSAIFVFCNSRFGRIRFLEVIINQLFLIKEVNYVKKRNNIIPNSPYLDINKFNLVSKREFREKYLLNIEEKGKGVSDENTSNKSNLSKSGHEKDFLKNNLFDKERNIVDFIKFGKDESNHFSKENMEIDIDNEINNEKNTFRAPKSTKKFVLNNKKNEFKISDKDLYDLNIKVKNDNPLFYPKNKPNEVSFHNLQNQADNRNNPKDPNYERNLIFHFENQMNEKHFLDIENSLKIKENKQANSGLIAYNHLKNSNFIASNNNSKRSQNSKTNLLNTNIDNWQGNISRFKTYPIEKADEKNTNNLILLQDTRLLRILDNLKIKDQRNKFHLDLAEAINFLKVRCCGINKLNKKFSRNYTILEEGEEKISQYLNLVKIIEKFENIDFITKLLLEDYQKTILEIINIPTLDISETNMNLGKNKNLNDFNNNFVSKKNKNKQRIHCSKENIKAINLFLKYYDENNDPRNKNIFKKLIE